MKDAGVIAQAHALLLRGDPRAAEVKLAEVWNASPVRPAAAMHVLGLIRRAQGRFADAENLFRDAIDADPQSADYHVSLGQLLLTAGFPEPAAEALAQALALNAKLPAALLGLARAQEALGNFIAAEAAARTLVEMAPSAEAWTALGGALRLQGRLDEAIAAFDAALAIDPQSAAARHDRAIALDKSGRGEEAVAVFSALHAQGRRAPALFRNWAGALMELGRHEEAQARLEDAVRHHPADPVVHASLARMRWLRGDTKDFCSTFLAAVRARPDDVSLRLGCADMLRRAERHAEAASLVREGLARRAGDASLLAAMGVIATETGDIQAAVPALREAVRQIPGALPLRENLIEALLAAGAPDEALSHIRVGRAARPMDGAWIAHEAVALRLSGDPAWRTLYDFDAMVRPYDLPVPQGYDSADAFNAALGERLRAMHTLAAHPLDQSLKSGTQTPRSLLEIDDPVIVAFRGAVDVVLTDYIARMPNAPAHPYWGRKPSSGRAKLSGCWSVRLSPGGFHVNHLHPEGWISSAYYVAVPPGVAGANDHQGWIQFGAPRWPTPGADPALFIEPKPGRLVLFPSYMWHGTVPFRDGEERLTVAFDAVPSV